jgi:transcriptional regulator with XRE-family HTH domain
MPPADPERSAMRSKLAAIRAERGLSQQALADRSGVALRTLARLERKEIRNPPLGYLANLSIVLRCRVSDLVEDDWLEWGVFRETGPKEPPTLRLRKRARV